MNYHDLQKEKELLGMILKRPKLLQASNVAISEDLFFSEINQNIFKKINSFITVKELNHNLSKEEWYKKAGGHTYLMECINLAEVEGISEYVLLVRELQDLKTIRDILNAIEKAKNEVGKEENDTIISGLLKQVRLMQRKSPLGDLDDLKNFDDIYGEDYGISTGLHDLDRLIGGLRKSNLIILGARPGAGKALTLNTKILTPNGWIKNKDIKVGDKVIGDDGKETNVVGVYPQGITKNYKITFFDGREQVCCENHLWKIAPCKIEEGVYNTKYLYEKLQCVRYQGRISIPVFMGEYGEYKDFIIPPYVMGVLIGDGCLTKGMCYSKPSDKVFLRVKNELKKYDVHKLGRRGMVSICGFYEGIKYLKEQGLRVCSYDKFIPEEYLLSSKDQRQELFEGLMDTDGHKWRKGYEYSTTSKRLSLEVQQLAFSLGYRCRIVERMGRYKKDGKYTETRVNYRVYISKGNSHGDKLTIKKIEPAEPEKTQCIMVDNDSHLFVIENYIVTHNSSCAATIAMNTSKEYNTLFFNLEMSSKEMKRKFIAIKSGVPYKKITENTCDNTERGFISQAIKAISESKIVLSSPEKKPNIAQIEKVATKIKDKQGLDLIIIDYLNYIKADDKRLQMTYQVEQKVQDLKMLAKQLDVPIILLVQLSREFDKRNANTSSAPFLSDIKDSGSIEQEADSVVLLHRESMYNNQNKGLAQFHVRKNRHGATGMRSLAFDEETGKFSNLIEEN